MNNKFLTLHFITLPNMFPQVDEDYMEALTNHELSL